MITETEKAAASVATPPANKKTLFLDTDGEFKTKDESGTVASLTGAQGPPGDDGADGQGVATGGTAGQFLRKQSGTDFDTAFAAVAQSEVTNLVTDLAAKAPLASPALTGTPTVPDDAYDATGWNGNNGIPTKNAVRDKIESLVIGGGSGAVVQVVTTQTGAVATGATSIPLDDSIPLNTEGDEYMTATITPTDAGNDLIIEVIWFGSAASASEIAVALFQDSTANALKAASSVQVTATGRSVIPLKHRMAAGTTSATTFKVRAGPNAGVTLTFNGMSGARLYGGVAASSITITEIVP